MEVSTFMFSTGLSNLLHAIAFLWPQLEVAPSTLRFKQYCITQSQKEFGILPAVQWQWRHIHFASFPVAMTTFCQLPSGNDDILPAAQWQWRQFASCPVAMTAFCPLPNGNDDILPAAQWQWRHFAFPSLSKIHLYSSVHAYPNPICISQYAVMNSVKDKTI